MTFEVLEGVCSKSLKKATRSLILFRNLNECSSIYVVLAGRQAARPAGRVGEVGFIFLLIFTFCLALFG